MLLIISFIFALLCGSAWAQEERLPEFINGPSGPVLYRAKVLNWEPRSNAEPLLRSECVVDGQGNVWLCKEFDYDEQGRVVQETLHGNLSGKQTSPLTMGSNSLPVEGQERYSSSFTYYEQGSFLVRTQIDDNGNCTKEISDLQTKRLVARLFSDPHGAHIRHFYFHDEEGNLIREEVDDGVSEEIDVLTEVTERWVTSCCFKKSASGKNLLMSREETHMDCKTQKDQLIKQWRYFYNSEDRLEREELEGLEIERRFFSYGPGGEQTVIFEKEQGVSYVECYNSARHKIYTIDPSGRKTTYKYDSLGRLTVIFHPEIMFEDGTLVQAEKEYYEYDIFDNVIKKMDDKGSLTRTSYNIRGKPVTIEHSDGTTEQFIYRLDGSLEKSTDSDGSGAEYRCDGLARPIEIQHFDSNKEITDISWNAYNSFHLTSTTNSEGHTIGFNPIKTAYNCVKKLYDGLSYAVACLYSYSSEPYLYSRMEDIGIALVGKGYLTMDGYYVDHLSSGIYGEREIGNHVRVTAINGILNLRENCRAYVKALSQSHGGVNIHYVFNPTEGWFCDISKAAMAKLGFVSTQVKLLAATWKHLIKEMGGPSNGGVIIHYAHSIGGTNTALAKDLLTPEEQKMIRVITVGSATAIPNQGFHSVINYVSRRDAVALPGWIQSLYNSETNVIPIGSYWGIPAIDHLLDMETYSTLIKTLGKEFVSTYER